MTLTRMAPTAALIGVLGLALAPVAYSLRMLGTQEPSSKRVQKKGATLAGFNGDRAYEYLVEQCEIGPRPSGSEGNQKLRKRMAEHFRSLGGEVTLQTFSVTHPLTGQPVEMENVVASWHPDRNRRVVIGAHFDTRPLPDRETNPRKRKEPFIGANDGASGVAVLMEMAHMLPELKTTVGVDLAAFDGEELVYDDDRDPYFLGSAHFAQSYRAAGKFRYVAGIVVDMVGDKSLEIYPDLVSARESPQLVQEVWTIARRLRASGFRSGRGHDIRDDHLSLLEVGIPAIDIIDFDYPHWHRVGDTPDKCSPASLAQVGGVVAEWLRTQ